jgi:hypothetical protein
MMTSVRVADDLYKVMGHLRLADAPDTGRSPERGGEARLYTRRGRASFTRNINRHVTQHIPASRFPHLRPPLLPVTAQLTACGPLTDLECWLMCRFKHLRLPGEGRNKAVAPLSPAPACASRLGKPSLLFADATFQDLTLVAFVPNTQCAPP